MSTVRILRDDPDAPAGEGVKFRLYYQGPLRSSSGEAREGQTDRRADHKHDLRRAFHLQLRNYWGLHPWLQKTQAGRDVLGLGIDRFKTLKDIPLMSESLADMHRLNDFRFVPLVCAQFKLLCRLDVLMLRRDRPGGIFQARDIDNRLKTLFDALRMPKHGGEILQKPTQDEDPFFILLQDDSLITHVSVETDELLDPPSGVDDDSYVRLVITVTLQPYEINMFNMNFG